ncbi:MAG: hypothetical protein KAS65_00085, partial [Candidatus Aminicenantes bacterium]|nr:hypothetical protein [Candidatus Aminicenantes bacterium]
MEKFIKFLCLSLIVSHIHVGLWAEKTLDFQGDYFIYSDDFHYLYGGGNIRLKAAGFQITGQSLYLDLNSFIGVIYGSITISGQGRLRKADILVFKGYPFSFR